jgi:hypothetical protein
MPGLPRGICFPAHAATPGAPGWPSLTQGAVAAPFGRTGFSQPLLARGATRAHAFLRQNAGLPAARCIGIVASRLPFGDWSAGNITRSRRRGIGLLETCSAGRRGILLRGLGGDRSANEWNEKSKSEQRYSTYWLPPCLTAGRSVSSSFRRSDGAIQIDGTRRDVSRRGHDSKLDLGPIDWTKVPHRHRGECDSGKTSQTPV